MTSKELEIAGCMIYACEGTKLRKDPRGKNTYIYAVEVTNSSPEIIAIFVRFLKSIVKPNWGKLRGQLFIYEDMDEQKIKKYWSSISEVPRSQFQKTITFKSKNGRFKPSKYGTFKLRYSSKKDFLLIQELIKKHLGEVA